MATRWGIASAGRISHDFVTALSILPASEHKVVAVAARDLSSAKDFAKLHNIPKAYGSYEKLAEDKDVEIVYVGSIHVTHLEISRMMMNNGKHVLCEKPLTMNLKQTRELVELAKSKKLFLMEAIWSRCFPAYDLMKQEIASGRIGEVKQVVACLGAKLSHVPRLVEKKLGGGTVLDLGVYPLQFALYVFEGAKVKSVKANGHLNQDGVDLNMSVSITFEGERTATLYTSSLVNLPNEAYVIGTEGTIRLPEMWCPTKIELSSGTEEFSLPKTEQIFNFHNSVGLSYEAVEARKCLQKELLESPKASHANSLLLAQLEDEIRKQLGVVYDDD